MNSDSIMLRLENSELYVVPAIHYHHLFALEVHRLCSDPETRPDAVAVELGPGIARDASSWLRELTMIDGRHKPLPVMLGILKRNRMLRASCKEKALQLQQESGRDLSELPPELLHRELGFSAYALICLTPADSIIEAMRCGIELGVPIFGVDLEDMADGIFKPVMVQDMNGEQNIVAFIERNAAYAEKQRDDDIDQRRETAMVARLKGIMLHHRRVLFTCGMAHWRRIRNMLENGVIKPALPTEYRDTDKDERTRVIVHPNIAVNVMDSFPALVRTYERHRVPVTAKADFANRRSPFDPAKIFDAQMKNSLRNFLSEGSKGVSNDRPRSSLDEFHDFERYLENLSLLNHSPVPNLAMTVKAAQETMSFEFVSALVDTFMKFPWASPAKFPGRPLLSQNNKAEDGSAILTINGHRHKSNLFLRNLPSGNAHIPSTIPYDWEKSKHFTSTYEIDDAIHTWFPWDCLISSLSMRAISKVAAKRIAKKTSFFEGSILEGIDIKSTIRASTRGDDRLYVKDHLQERGEHANFINAFPVVWLLQPDGNNENGDWILLNEPFSYMDRHVRDKMLMENIAQKFGNNMVAVIAHGKGAYLDKEGSWKSKIRLDQHAGILIFQPICWTNKQFAHWAELTGYRRNPFSQDFSLFTGLFCGLAHYYSEVHGIRIGELHWSTTMILLALPFAKDILTVVVPDGYRTDPVVARKAKKYGVQVELVPHSLFSRAELDRLAKCYLVPAMNTEPSCIYSRDIEKIIGEQQTDNRHLVPQAVLDFGNMA